MRETESSFRSNRQNEPILTVRWMIEDGEGMTSTLGYALLLKSVTLKVKRKIAELR
jgi:hypothetical protein